MAAELLDHNLAEVAVGTTEALNELQAHVLRAFAVTSHGQEEDTNIIDQTSPTQ